jgi:hypothetical protein
VLTSCRGRGPARRDYTPHAVSEVEKAYFAGYTDAEGCIGLVAFTRGPSRYWSAFVSFGQTQPAAVERLHALYGGRLRSRKRGHRRRQKEWCLTGIEDVRRFLSDISPYLREKHPQAAIVLNEFDPKAEQAMNEALLRRLVQLKAKRLGDVTITSRLSIAPQAQRTCLDCGARSVSRGFCAKHYQRAKRDGRITTNPKGTGVPFTYGRTLNEGEPPYFAGYFDGDGCIAISPEKRRWYPRVAFAQTQPDTLMELHALYGGSLTVGAPKDPTRRPKLVYQLVQRHAVLALLRDIQPFLIEKRDQVELFLERYQADLSFEDGKKLKSQLSEMKRRTFDETSEVPRNVDP